jgi:uncharacterized membrane protein
MTDRTAWGRPRPTRRTAAGPQALPATRGRAWALLRRRAVQRGIRAAIAAGLAWQVAVRMPPLPWRRRAGLALAAYLVAVFPANVYVAVAGIDVEGQPGGWYPWLRLPFQVLFVAWALWSTEWDLRQLRAAANRLVGRTPRAEEVAPVASRAER